MDRRQFPSTPALALAPAPPGTLRIHCQVGPDRLIFAGDHPWVNPKLIAKNWRSLKFSAEEENKIFSGNARRLFRL